MGRIIKIDNNQREKHQRDMSGHALFHVCTFFTISWDICGLAAHCCWNVESLMQVIHITNSVSNQVEDEEWHWGYDVCQKLRFLRSLAWNLFCTSVNVQNVAINVIACMVSIVGLILTTKKKLHAMSFYKCLLKYDFKNVLSKNGITRGKNLWKESERNVHSFLLIKERIVNKHSVK